eukprot:5455825-Pyramimonas_sp.AAC.1
MALAEVTTRPTSHPPHLGPPRRKNSGLPTWRRSWTHVRDVREPSAECTGGGCDGPAPRAQHAGTACGHTCAGPGL